MNGQDEITKTFGKGLTGERLDELCVNTIRCLTMDIVEKAKSGHPGLPMGNSDFAYVFWMKILKHSPANPCWIDRDRFILSAGHGSPLLYAMLHLSGYPGVEMEDLKNFRQWESRTPGHPERWCLPGVETTSGPLGQGFANGVGMAMAERYLAALFNREEEIIDHYTYALVSDGELMEGVASEAASLAGHLKLGKLIYFYDDNRITIEGATELAFSEDVARRFEAYGWHVQRIDGHDLKAIEKAFAEAKKTTDRPHIIVARTIIGKGSPNKQATASSHGSPLGEEEAKLTKQNLGWPLEPAFLVPEAVRQVFRRRKEELMPAPAAWEKKLDAWKKKHPELLPLWEEVMEGKLPDLDAALKDYRPDKPNATRNSSGEVIQKLAPAVKNLIGGSADLSPSTKTMIKGMDSFQAGKYGGRNLHFGVREHAMGSILNGLALHGGIIPYGGTFLVFADYMRPPIRMASMMGLQVIYVFTHDSIFVGEDGPTHQPVEHFASLRIFPGLTVIRPADATETAVAWKTALKRKDGPTALLLSRQTMPLIDRARYPSAELLAKGAYIMKDPPKPEIILIATGSEVSVALDAADMMEKEGKRARVVNMPSWELFEAQPEEYRRKVLPPEIRKRLVIEAASPMGWERYAGDQGEIIAIANRFGASAPWKLLAEKFGFTAENVKNRALALLKK